MIPDFTRGNCYSADPDQFFPTNYGATETKRTISVYCAPCPILEACLEWALRVEGGISHSGREGVFGGTTPRQRARMAIARARLERGAA